MPDVLLIEDDPKIARALSVRLGTVGLSVRTAPTGELGLEQVREQTPDVAVLDVRLPGINGIETCRQIKADPRSARCAVLFLSAETSEQTRAAALDAGGRSFFSKPYDAGQLTRAILEAAEHHPA